jgi:hypothetical protein
VAGVTSHRLRDIIRISTGAMIMAQIRYIVDDVDAAVGFSLHGPGG